MVNLPYLIQRASINTPLAAPSARLSQAVNFDYMGSAEFEFGALPRSFRNIEAQTVSWGRVLFKKSQRMARHFTSGVRLPMRTLKSTKNFSFFLEKVSPVPKKLLASVKDMIKTEFHTTILISGGISVTM